MRNVYKKITSLLVMLFSTSVLCAQSSLPVEWEGRWWLGVLKGALPINLTFEMVAEDSLAAVLFSPMQSSNAIPVSDCSFNSDTLTLKCKSLSMTMKLFWNENDSTFSGMFKQGMVKADVSFSPTDGIYQNKPTQSVVADGSYVSRDFTLKRKRDGVVLSGTITIPRGKGRFPAVVLVNGSGQQDRDCTIAGHKPFAVLADYLTRQGIVVLRYDDRGVGGSKGDVLSATTYDFADDAEAVFEYLRKQPYVDKNSVGIVGHSEGGIIAPLVASRNEKVKFVVMLAGQGTSGAQVLLDQNHHLLSQQGLSDSLIGRRLDCMREMFALDSNSVNLTNIRNIIQRHAEGLGDDERMSVGLRRSDAVLWNQQLQMPWMQSFIKVNPMDYLPKVSCPVLAVNGEKDLQVIVSNLIKIKELIPHADTMSYPELNHLFQHCETGSPDEYFSIKESFSEEVMRDLSVWILKRR